MNQFWNFTSWHFFLQHQTFHLKCSIVMLCISKVAFGYLPWYVECLTLRLCSFLWYHSWASRALFDSLRFWWFSHHCCQLLTWNLVLIAVAVTLTYISHDYEFPYHKQHLAWTCSLLLWGISAVAHNHSSSKFFVSCWIDSQTYCIWEKGNWKTPLQYALEVILSVNI